MSEVPSARSAGGGLQTVDRALTLLKLMARSGECGVSDLADELDVHKSTAYRLLGALEAHDLVEQTEDRGKYRLGFELVLLAGAVSGRMDVTRRTRPVTEQLANDVGETVHLAVLREHYAVNVDQVLGDASVATQNWVGRLTPLHATSSGKALLAHVDAQERKRLLKVSGLTGFTSRTITSIGALETELAQILEQGYAVSVGEYEDGLNGIAVPVSGVDGTVVAALSASGPAYRFTPARMQDMVTLMREAGTEASRRLGHLAD